MINANVDFILNLDYTEEFLNDLCNNGNLLTEYIIDNHYEEYLRALSTRDRTRFAQFFEFISFLQFTDNETAISWIMSNINPTTLKNLLESNWINWLTCEEKTAIILSMENYIDPLKQYLSTQNAYELFLLTLTPELVLQALNEYSSAEVKSTILSSFNLADIYAWYKTNAHADFIISTVTIMPKRVAFWQTANTNNNMQEYFGFVRNYYGQSIYDVLLTKFLDKSNFYVDSINLIEWHIYGSSRLGIYATTLNLAWQRFQASVTNGQYANVQNTVLVVNTPSYNFFYLHRGKKRYELTNHLGNVLAVISDMKLYECHKYDKYVNFEDSPNILGDWNIRDSWEAQNAIISLQNGKLHGVEEITSNPHARVNYITANHLPPNNTYKISFDLEQIAGDPNWQIGIVTANSSTSYEANFTFFSASAGHNEILVHPSQHIWRIRFLHLQTAQDIEFTIDNFRIQNLSLDTFTHQIADVISATDYSPFGAPLPERTFSASDYRFGFN
uniref:hypothetical protein n=1 Tax=Umezakia ovalisporum TaxID=75695 RepID=UPI0039C6821B